MGLFDELRVERGMPDGESHVVFQTKDFDQPYMEQYVIRSDGRLIRKKRWWAKDDPQEPEETDMDFHGILHFHTWDDEKKELREYVAKFTDGNLVMIQRTAP